MKTIEEIEEQISQAAYEAEVGSFGKITELVNEIISLYAEIEIDNRLLFESNRVLDAIPECKSHGHRCIPHALSWIEEAKKKMDTIQVKE